MAEGEAGVAMGEEGGGTRVTMDASRIHSSLYPAISLITASKVVAAPWVACMSLAAMWLRQQHRLPVLSWTGRPHSVPPSSAPRPVLPWMSTYKGTLALKAGQVSWLIMSVHAARG